MNTMPTPPTDLPEGWLPDVHAAWQAGQRERAIQLLLADLNAHGAGKPVRQVLQFVYYLFQLGDYAAAARFLDMQNAQTPGDPQMLLNLAVCLSRSGQAEPAVVRARELLTLQPGDAVALDVLATCLHRLGRLGEAAEAGTQALVAKDRAARRLGPLDWQPPAGTPAQWLAARPERVSVLSFSLWGASPRYLRGALDNALAAPRVYPGWQMRVHADDSVPAELLQALRGLGVEVRLQPAGQTLRQKLCWRFQVADDTAVGRFAVRDIDSVVNPRERAAVADWEASDAWFHVMRDWWSHTDLMLAGMWGGVAGVLPRLAPLLAGYRPATMETPNIDQWFLRDVVWAYARASCRVHDRCFAMPGSVPWPQAAPQGDGHVGQDVHAVQRDQQARRLAPWAAQLACLGPVSAGDERRP